MNPSRLEKMTDALVEGLVSEEQIEEVFQAVVKLITESTNKTDSALAEQDRAIEDFGTQISSIFENTTNDIKSQQEAVDSVVGMVEELKKEVANMVLEDGEDADVSEAVEVVLNTIEPKFDALRQLIPERQEQTAVTGVEARDALDSLEGDERLSVRALKDWEDFETNVNRMFSRAGHGSGGGNVRALDEGVLLGDAPIKEINFVGTGVTAVRDGDRVTATISALASAALNDLTDVTITAPANAQIIQYNATSGRWENADQAGGGDMTKAIYDPNAVNGDAFDMDNMVEGTNLILTAAERAKLTNTSGTNTGDQDLSGLATKANVLELNNTTPFTPDADYEPATKKYVDDNAGGIADGDKGDITVSASGTTWTIDDEATTFAKMQHIATNRILGRSTAGTGDIEALADNDARTIMGLATADSPQFTGINLGHATDTTITRVSAGVIAVEGTNVSLSGHTHTASEVTDFDTEVANNSAVTANTAKLTADTTNVTAAGALMDSEVTNLAQVKAFDASDYAPALGADDNYVTDNEKAVVGKRTIQLLVEAGGTDLATGNQLNGNFCRIPADMNGWNLVSVAAVVNGAGTTGTTDIQIRNYTQDQDMLSTKITIDSGETDSKDAAIPAVINTAADDVATGDKIAVDVDAVQTTAPTGLLVELTFQTT